jgi:hypothetical protein
MILKRIQNKLIRESNKYILLFDCLLRAGFKSAIYLDSEQKAFIKGDWALFKSCFEQRVINISFKKKSNNFSKAFSYIIEDSNSCEDIVLFLKKEENEIRTNDLESLYKYCKYFNDLRIAIFLRKVLIRRAVAKQKKSLFVTKRGINAALESHQYKLAKYFLNKKIRFFGKDYFDYANKILDNFLKSGLYNYNSKDFDFHNYVSGKTVAIVGPGVPDDEPGEEIDSYDIVIRTNYRDESNIPYEKFGKRTDVSYYNHQRLNTFLHEVIKSTSEINWTILKNEGAKNILNEGIMNNFPYNARSMLILNDLFFLGSQPMSIPNIVADILNFNPLSVKLFCVNFYNSNNNYSAHYKKNISIDKSSQSNDLRIHEPFANFSFIKGCFINNLIEVDELTRNTLELTDEEYAESLNNIFGSKGLS